MLLVNKDTDQSEPVAVQVPPPKPEAVAKVTSLANEIPHNESQDVGRPGAITRGKVRLGRREGEIGRLVSSCFRTF